MDAARFASALSTASDSARAEAEVASRLTETLAGAEPDLVVLFASHHHGPALEGLGARIRRAVGARRLVGCTGESIVGGAREVEQGPALSLWAVSAPGFDPQPFRVEPIQNEDDQLVFNQLPPVEDREHAALLLFADPYTFPMGDYLRILNEELPGVPAVGGMASGGMGPGQNLLFSDDDVLAGGCVGIVVEGGIELCSVVSQGCRPVGQPRVITSCKDNLIQKLGGRPAAEILLETLRELPEDERELLRRGPFVGLAFDSNKQEFDRGDFLVRRIIQARGGTIAIDETAIRNGLTIQFLVRDASTAGEDLSELMQARAGGWKDGERGALLFSCNGRGSRMFDTPDHDATRVQSVLGEVPMAGFFAMGEIGPVGGRNFLHGFTASIAVFRPTE